MTYLASFSPWRPHSWYSFYSSILFTSSEDADGKLSMTIKMFASYIRRNDCTLSTYFTMQVFQWHLSHFLLWLSYFSVRPSVRPSFLSFFLSFLLSFFPPCKFESMVESNESTIRSKLIKIKMSTARIPSLKVSSANCIYSASALIYL